jgi:hypothetical protein
MRGRFGFEAVNRATNCNEASILSHRRILEVTWTYSLAELAALNESRDLRNLGQRSIHVSRRPHISHYGQSRRCGNAGRARGTGLPIRRLALVSTGAPYPLGRRQILRSQRVRAQDAISAKRS